MRTISYNCHDPLLTLSQSPNLMGFGKLTYPQLFSALVGIHVAPWLADCITAGHTCGSLFVSISSGQTHGLQLGPFVG